MKEVAKDMTCSRRGVIIPLIAIILLCAACSSAVTGTDSSDLSAPPETAEHASSPSPLESAALAPATAGETGDTTSPIQSEEPLTHAEPSDPGGTIVTTGTPGPDGTDGAVGDNEGAGQGDQHQALQASDGSETEHGSPPSPDNTSAPASADDTGGIALVPEDDGPVILTIGGDGVNTETTWTLNQLQAFQDGFRDITYSTTNNWPSFSAMTAQGVSLPYLLRQAGLADNAASFKFTSTDGFYTTLTHDQVFGTLYSYADHSATGSSGEYAVESIIAWIWGDVGKARPENIRPFFGQSGPWEVNTSSFVKNLCKIEVFTSTAGVWDVPVSSVADGATVSEGTELELSHSNMDSVRIYYTLDGSEPDYYSPVYNPSTAYFQPQLTKPLVLSESITVKAFAAGLGRERSATVTFVITVE